MGQAGCKSPREYRKEADKTAYDIIKQKQREAIGEVEGFTIERPSDILRRRLLEGQNLQYSGPGSLGTDRLEQPEHWPQDDYPEDMNLVPLVPLEGAESITLTLLEALQVGARNNFSYQTQKEEIFRTALALDLQRDVFRDFFTEQADSLISTDSSSDRTISGTRQSSVSGWSRALKSGAVFSAQMAVDLANLLTMGGASALGLEADASVSMPLLRGSGAHIVTEPLTQAERNVLYAIWEFERFKRTFAVNIAAEYLAVLQALDRIANEEANYRSLIMSVRRSRRLADSGDMDVIQVDQAVQNELRARNRWIVAKQNYERSLDNFRILLGLPVDANIIELDRAELDKLVETVSASIIDLSKFVTDPNDEVPPADARIELAQPSQVGAGPYEIDRLLATRLALENRLDLRVVQEKVFDAQRGVILWADRLGAELTFLGSASAGGRRTVGSATSDDARIRLNEAELSGLLTLDLPLERVAERNDYRNSLIGLERAVRNVQSLEDQVKLDVRSGLRALQSTRESLQIQARAVQLAEKRVSSTNMALEAGRAQIRDSLEAQEALLSAQNDLTAAVINYRMTELELQRDIGLLEVDEQGLWQEFDPEVTLK
ncbi:MAG: TolC family protein [Planctomycetes bacterium]|nr:TolC family protein [Planctomycetota bacterium]